MPFILKQHTHKYKHKNRINTAIEFENIAKGGSLSSILGNANENNDNDNSNENDEYWEDETNEYNNNKNDNEKNKNKNEKIDIDPELEKELASIYNEYMLNNTENTEKTNPNKFIESVIPRTDSIKGNMTKEKRDKLFQQFINLRTRKTAWEIQIKSGEYKILQKMVKSKGFRLSNVERVGYGNLNINNLKIGPKFINDKNIRYKNDIQKLIEFKQKQNKKNNASNPSTDSNLLQNMTEYQNIEIAYNNYKNSDFVKLKKNQIQSLWECVGGMKIGVIVKLESLFERANRLNDADFWIWLESIGVKL